MHDVIVVGGGPTGFLTALGLAQAGVGVVLLEAGDHIVDSPRAAVYHWSLLDGLERLGIREEAEATGIVKDDYTWLIRKTGEHIRYRLDVLNDRTDYNYNINMGQDVLANIARTRLEKLSNAEIRFGARVEALAQDGDGVTVTLADGEAVRAKYLVGADGAGSTVRQALGLTFDGFTWPERFIATNVYHDFAGAGYGLSTMVVDDKWGAVIVIIAQDGLWRCTYMEDASLPEESYLDRLPAAYEHLLPGEGGYELFSAAPYKMHQRCASQFRVGRVVLAGDSAHVTNPTGGFGLTTGLFDCYALWPTLAAIILDRASPDLLDIWAAERRAIFLEKTSPMACQYKDFLFHECGGDKAKLEEAIAGMRRMQDDPDYCRERLMFTKRMETTSPAER
ncbi:FAD-dependent oxidoreductase [Alteraurantiacibacter aquimixticola]|nr:NAD(P)/FAD-dependent oxidoreductase [Alteraurantiacibacter aquimixticola]